MSLQGFTEGPFTYVNGDTGVIPANYLVTLTSTEGEVVCCGSEGVPVGIASGDVAVGAEGDFFPLRGRVKLVATDNAAITAGMLVKADAGGTVVKGDTGTAIVPNAFTFGQAETAVSGDTGASTAIYVVVPR